LRIEEHPLLNKAHEEMKPLIGSITPEDFVIESSKERHRRAPKLSTKQRYHYYVLYYTGNILDAFSRLNHATIYIKNFPKPASYLRQGVTEHDWIQYHYLVYILSIAGLYDIALKLTNGVFRLGLNEKIVNKSTVEDNLWVKSTRVSKLLDTLRKATSQVREPRNLFIHGGDLLKLDELHLLSIICMYTKTATKYYGTSEYPANSIKKQFQVDADELTNKMSRQISSLENDVINLFDELLPIYDFHSSSFKSIKNTRKLH